MTLSANPSPPARPESSDARRALAELAGPLLLLTAAAIISAWAVNELTGRPLSWSWRPAAAEAAVFEDFDELQTLLARPSTILLDARAAALFRLGRLPGAKSLPAAEAAQKVGPFLAATAPEALIVTYCAESLCPLAGQLAQALRKAGHADVRVFSPGFDAWLDAGRPIEAD
ncbi:MAG: rhodanese-like domain-containing protein [Deltaproteobacteria bacterium]|jgi:rhodanese-related sulfurtransferase|nr:rhodanese-like domain-containing protein [Deltaproteobacteria bacterium]